MRVRLTSRRDHERGAIILLTAILALSLLTFTAFSVDIGHESDVKRHLHVVADLAAQDALYALGTANAMANAVALATSSAASNGHPLTGSNTLFVQLGTWSGSPPGFQALNPDCSVSLPSGSTPSCPSATSANAIKVTAANSIIWNFASGGQGLSATAIAHPDGFTGLEVGTFDASAGLSASQQTLLNAELGVTGVSYDGLAGAAIKLNDLATQLGFASTDAMLKGTTTYGPLLTAAAQALTSEGMTSAAASMTGIASAVNAVGTTGGAGAAAGASVPLGSLYTATVSGQGAGGFGGGAAVAGNAGIDALGLITAGLDTAVINRSSFASLNNVNLNIANVTSIDAGVKVIRSPGFGFGFGCGVTTTEPPPLLGTLGPQSTQRCAQATSSQLEGQVVAHLPTVTVPITGLVGLGLTTATATITANIPLYFDNAGAHAWVSYVSCTSPTDHQANVDAWVKTGLAHLLIGQSSSLTTSTGQTDYTGGVSGSLSVTGPDGTPVAVNGATFTTVTIPAMNVTANISNNGAVTVLSRGPVLAQPSSATSAVPSYSGPFASPTSALPANSPGYRGPDRVTATSFATGLAVTPPQTGATGNGVTDALASLAAGLPDLHPPVDAAMTAAGVSPVNQAAVDAALNVPLTNELATIRSVLSALDSTVLAPLSASFAGSLAGAVVTNLATKDTSPPNGTACVGRIVQ